MASKLRSPIKVAILISGNSVTKSKLTSCNPLPSFNSALCSVEFFKSNLFQCACILVTLYSLDFVGSFCIRIAETGLLFGWQMALELGGVN